MEHFIQGDRIWWDTETTGLYSWLGDQPFAFSFCNEAGETAYFEFPVDPFTRQVIYDPDILHTIRLLLEDEGIIKGGHNLKFDTRMVELGCDIVVAGPGGPIREGGRCEETMFMAHACNSLEVNYKLKRLSESYGALDTEDQDLLQKSTNKLRRRAKKLGWKIAYEERPQPDGTIKYEAATPADYWLGFNMFQLHPDLCSEEEAGYCEHYARKDAFRAMIMGMFYYDRMEELGVRHVYDFEMQNWPVFYRMETRGVCLRPDRLQLEIDNAVKRMAEEEPKFMKYAWPGFNVDADDDVRKLLYEKLKLPIDEEHRTKKRKDPGANFKALKGLRHHEVVRAILKHRGVNKAFGFFSQYRRRAVEDHLNPGGLVLHPDFHQVGPKTGRTSCSDPNVQQVTSLDASRSAEPVDARGSYGPRPGFWWLHNDYRGMEVRIFAEVAQEPNMLRAIAEGREIHDEVTNRGWGGKDNPVGISECVHALGLDGSDVGEKPEVQALWKVFGIKNLSALTERDKSRIAAEWLGMYNWDIVRTQESIGLKVTKNKAKMVTFLKIYGGGPDAAAELLEVTRWDAVEFLQHYDRTFPRIPEYAKELEAEARLDQCIHTLWGRRLTVLPQKAYRCVNYMVQGSAADLLKSAMIKCDAWLRESGLDAHLIMTIHDELVFEIRKHLMTFPLVRKIMDLMEDTDGKLVVPMPTDPSVTTSSWNEKKKIKMPEVCVAA
jgi:DNA polymerase I-like protein with 3'-5' exonuclease and polymerase domains